LDSGSFAYQGKYNQLGRKWNENIPEMRFKLRGSDHPIPYDSMNCIRFCGYALSSGFSPEHPNRNILKIGALTSEVKGFV